MKIGFITTSSISTISKGAHLTSATVPWHWLFFCPVPKVRAYFGRPVTKSLDSLKWRQLIFVPMCALEYFKIYFPNCINTIYHVRQSVSDTNSCIRLVMYWVGKSRVRIRFGLDKVWIKTQLGWPLELQVRVAIFLGGGLNTSGSIYLSPKLAENKVFTSYSRAKWSDNTELIFQYIQWIIGYS